MDCAPVVIQKSLGFEARSSEATCLIFRERSAKPLASFLGAKREAPKLLASFLGTKREAPKLLASLASEPGRSHLLQF